MKLIRYFSLAFNGVESRQATLSFFVSAVGLLLILTSQSGCGSGTIHWNQPPTPRPPTLYHAYVSTLNATIQRYDVPMYQTSAPSATVSLSSPGLMAEDQTGTLYVVQSSNNVVAVAASIGFGPTQFTLRVPTGTGHTEAPSAAAVAIDRAGNLYVSNPSDPAIDVYSAPVTSSSTVAYRFSTGGDIPGALCFDPTGDLFVADGPRIIMIPQPYMTSPRTSFALTLYSATSVACDSGGNIYVGGGTAHDKIDVYQSPYSASSTPVFSLSLPGSNTAYVAAVSFDPGGDLFATIIDSSNNPNGLLVEYTPPLTASSNPYLIYPLSNANTVAAGQ